MVRRTNPIEFPELILRRLALNPELATNLSSVKGLTRYQISGGFDEGDKVIPQSTILAYTKILEDRGWIRSISKVKIPTGKYKITYDLTTLGLIKWLHYLNNNWKNFDPKRVEEVIESSQRLLPFISSNWVKLKEIFKDGNVMILTLLGITDIEVQGSVDGNSVRSSAYAIVNVGGLKIHVSNEVESPIPKQHRTKTVLDDTSRNLEELFTFVYIYRLETQQGRKTYYENRKKVFSLIKSDPNFHNAYLKFVRRLHIQLVKAADHLENIEFALRDNN